MARLTSLEICAGAGGQAIGLENAGFHHVALVEIEHIACQTMRYNRPQWNVIEKNIKYFDATEYHNKVDLFSGGVPCPPFSVAGKQLGGDDERDLFPEAIRLIEECNPKAIMLENVKGLLEPKFKDYREQLLECLSYLGYKCQWKLLHASDFGVPQLRPRAILVGMKKEYFANFKWPEKLKNPTPTVGDTLFRLMSAKQWKQAALWKEKAAGIAPTLVGGSKKHGGADLGPTRAKIMWAKLGVDGKGLADHVPDKDYEGMPRLTLQMTALIQGFPAEWKFAGKKTPAYRQVGNAFPPPVAQALGAAIVKALLIDGKEDSKNRFESKAKTILH